MLPRSRTIGRHTGWVLSFCIVFVACASTDLVPALKAKAASDFKCAPNDLTNQGIHAHLDRVDGCGRQNMYAYDHSAERWVSPLDRAEFELGCKRDQLSTTVLGTNTVGVAGCDKQAVYVLLRTGWVMNTSSESK
jgi:hypothetical protein